MVKCQKVTAEFKREAVSSLQKAGKSAMVVAREFGTPRNWVYKCADEAKKGDAAFRSVRSDQSRLSELFVLMRESVRLQ